MPNECTNFITITCKDEEVLNKLVREELQIFDGNNYVYKEYVKMKKRGYRGIYFIMYSAWTPDYKWLERLLEKYPDCWVKNEWQEEGGLAGYWIGYFDENEQVIQDSCWRDLSIEERHYLFLEKNEEKETQKSDSNLQIK